MLLDTQPMNSPSLFVIHPDASPNSLERVALLREAAEERDIPFVALNNQEINFCALPTLRRGDMLFNSGRGSIRLETLLTVPGLSTFRTGNPSRIENGGDTTILTAVHDRLQLPGPKTIHYVSPGCDRLDEYWAYLNGPPVVVKAADSTRGQGAVLCPDIASMKATIKRFSDENREFIVREFILHTELLRVVVLGDRVLCTLAHPLRPDDFRSTIDGTYEHRPEPNEAVEQLAIAALQACAYEFGGLDIIDDPERGPLLIEANPPANFASIRRKLGIDIAGPMVEHLLEKSKHILLRTVAPNAGPQ